MPDIFKFVSNFNTSSPITFTTTPGDTFLVLVFTDEEIPVKILARVI